VIGKYPFGNKSAFKHGLTKTKAYASWGRMMNRCYNKNGPDYKHYGGRGITVCKRWQQPENFINDMGQPPDGLTLERKDNNKGYSKRNCVWAPRSAQTKNRRYNVKLTLNGETKIISDWARDLGLGSAVALRKRLQRGWSLKQSLTTPCGATNRRLPL
jgi:hypothetical protein